MARINSRNEMREYCLRALGAPVIEINVDDDQIEDRIDEGLEFFQEYHRNAIEKVYLKHEVVDDDITNGWIPIPDIITEVVRIFPMNGVRGSMLEYQLRLGDLYSMSFMGSVADYVMKQQWLSLVEHQISGSHTKYISFDRHKNELRIDMNWEKEVVPGDFIVVECYRIIDPETYTDIYDDFFLKKYVTALIKQQWGINLSKFEGMQMPGGVTFNGRQIFDDAREEITRLEEDCRLAWEEPLGFIVA